APGVLLAVDEDAAVARVRRDQAEVVAQGARERIAMRIESAVRRQRGEHRRLDAGDGFQQRHGLRAQRLGRGQRLAVPLEVEAFPALLEEAVETGVAAVLRGADMAFV